MITQLYEISSQEEVQLCIDAGVDHVGVLVGEGQFPRELRLDEAAQLLATLPEGVLGSALSLSGDTALIERIISVVQPDILHLGAAPEALSLDQVRNLVGPEPSMAIMRSIPVVDDSAIELARGYDGIVDWLLLDSHAPGDKQVGALGITHDWDISRRIVEAVLTPCILAGGLGPSNVAAAITAVRPTGVDSKTKTDKTGSHDKDPTKVRQFVERARKQHDRDD
jgi:phosphoribosylanthranilate isomerase